MRLVTLIVQKKKKKNHENSIYHASKNVILILK